MATPKELKETLNGLSDRLTDLIRCEAALPPATESAWWTASIQYSYFVALKFCRNSADLDPQVIASETVSNLHPRFPQALATLECRFSTYLHQATRFVFIDHLDRVVVDRQRHGGSPDELLGGVEADDSDPEKSLLLKDLVTLVMKQLSAKEGAIVLQLTKEISVEEALRRTGWSRPKFFRMKERLIQRLRRFLDDSGLRDLMN